MNERANRIANGFDPRWPKAASGTTLPFRPNPGHPGRPMFDLPTRPNPTRPDPSLTERDPNRRRLRDWLR